MSFSFGRVLLPLLFVGACSFPDYTFTPSVDGGAGQAGSAGGPASTCTDGIQGADETGVDCGGVCKACVTALPTCADGVQGDNETSIDCGGICPGCAPYEDCETGDDCLSGNCDHGVCQPATCKDNLKNGEESDKDCGRVCPTLCAPGLRCASQADCDSGVCSESLCRSPTCSDHVLNGAESGVDCGGSCPTPCALGMSCRVAADCASGTCDVNQLVCVELKCQNKVVDNQETDQDCGGPNCAPCGPSLKCLQNSDCDSGLCNSGNKTCLKSTCSDRVINEDETDVDCGGPNCGKCALTQKCRIITDCATNACQYEECVPSTATGAHVDEAGWVTTAAQTFSSSSPRYLIDGDPNNRWTSGTHQDTDLWIQLDMSKPQIFFTVTLDTTMWPSDAGRSYNVYVSMDGDISKVQPKHFAAGKPVQALVFDTAQVGRYIRIQLAEPGTEWWSVGELTVAQ